MKASRHGRTVTFDVPLLPFLPSVAAVMVTGPPPEVAVTRPVDDTVAIAGSLVAHVIAVPGTTSPLPSTAVAVNSIVAPIGIVMVGGDTLIEATAPGAPLPKFGRTSYAVADVGASVLHATRLATNVAAITPVPMRAPF